MRFRLRPTMKQGTASSVAETWMHFGSLEDARTAAKRMYHDDRVLRVMLVVGSPGTFVVDRPLVIRPVPAFF